MKVRELIKALKSANPDDEVYATIEDDEWPVTRVTREHGRLGGRYLRLCREGGEISAHETTLYDDNPPDLDPCSDAARAEGCSCSMSSVNSASIDPPEPIIDQWCPLHGRDPDYEMEKRRDARLDRVS